MRLLLDWNILLGISRRFTAHLWVQITKDKQKRKKIRNFIERRTLIFNAGDSDKKIPKQTIEKINHFDNDDFLALNFLNNKDKHKTLTKTTKISSNSQISKKYFIHSNQLENLYNLLQQNIDMQEERKGRRHYGFFDFDSNSKIISSLPSSQSLYPMTPRWIAGRIESKLALSVFASFFTHT